MKPSTAKPAPMMIAVYGGGGGNAITPVAPATPARSPSPTKVYTKGVDEVTVDGKKVDVEKG